MSELVKYEIGRNTDVLEHYHPFTNKQMRFIEEYAKTFDRYVAAKNAGYANPKQDVYRLTKVEAVSNELRAIDEARFTAVRMTGEMAAARHINIMNKVENDYDNAIEIADKAKLAGPLSKMSGDYLKAAGLFDKQQEQSQSNISINIDLGGNDKPIIIDGEKVE